MTPLFSADRIALERQWQKQAIKPNTREFIAGRPAGIVHTGTVGYGKTAVCPVLKQAAEKFATFKPASTIHPNGA
ncbi:hypothetical protein [Larkinella arboricola]|uniref:hypothetical protein n=1 Tax=Larkinella arboricola TaxID=643671 RepID=UPI0011BA4DF4|nr:hypothetical protein [Larkinella arboricola]